MPGPKVPIGRAAEVSTWCTPSSDSLQELSRRWPQNGRWGGRSRAGCGLPCCKAAAPRTDRLERMTNLVLVLLETPCPLSLREIASTVLGYPEGKEASRQAFERDKRALRGPASPSPSCRSRRGTARLPHPPRGLLPSRASTRACRAAGSELRCGGGAARRRRRPGCRRQARCTARCPSRACRRSPSCRRCRRSGSCTRPSRDRALVSFGYRGRRREVEPYGLTFKRRPGISSGARPYGAGCRAADVPSRSFRGRAGSRVVGRVRVPADSTCVTPCDLCRGRSATRLRRPVPPRPTAASQWRLTR